MSRYPARVSVYEVGPRDGLQNEAGFVPTETKRAFVEALAAAGLPAVEVTSFVSPKAVPALADGAELFRAIVKRAGTRYPVLVPNEKGYLAAKDAGASEIAVFTAASESFNRKNIGCGIDDSFVRFAPVLERAAGDGLRVRGYVSTAFHCPYEGKIEPAEAIPIVRRLFEAGCSEVSIGDTIGAAVPSDVTRLLDLADHFDLPLHQVALHFHDTRGTALANVMAGLEAGITTFDSSAGGLGGCPYAPGASGNLATEDLVYLLEGLGIRTGVDLDAVRNASLAIAEALGRTLPSKVLKAGRLRPLGVIEKPVEAR